MNQDSNHSKDTEAKPWVQVPEGVERLASKLVEASFRVHRELGPGLLEGVYEQCLAWELEQLGVTVDRQVGLNLVYRGHPVGTAFRADLLLRGDGDLALLGEVKAVDALTPLSKAQVISYLKVARLPLGLLINFNTSLLRDGIVRVLNRDWTVTG